MLEVLIKDTDGSLGYVLIHEDGKAPYNVIMYQNRLPNEFVNGDMSEDEAMERISNGKTYVANCKSLEEAMEVVLGFWFIEQDELCPITLHLNLKSAVEIFKQSDNEIEFFKVEA